jgi:hypothetical protein
MKLMLGHLLALLARTHIGAAPGSTDDPLLVVDDATPDEERGDW